MHQAIAKRIFLKEFDDVLWMSCIFLWVIMSLQGVNQMVRSHSTVMKSMNPEKEDTY